MMGGPLMSHLAPLGRIRESRGYLARGQANREGEFRVLEGLIKHDE